MKKLIIILPLVFLLFPLLNVKGRSYPVTKEVSDNEFDQLNFEKHNIAELPNYKVSKNLIQNPSFEEGLHGWFASRSPQVSDPDHLKQAIIVDPTTAYDGKCSLRFQHRVKQDGSGSSFIGMYSPYAFQFKPNTKYTLSFYGKSEQDGLKFTIFINGKKWAKWEGTYSFKLSNEWKRYSVSFSINDNLAQFYLGVPWFDKQTLSSITGAKVNFWIDCMQLEEGELTPYTMKPLSISMQRTPSVLHVADQKTLAFDCINNTDKPQSADVSFVIRDLYKTNLYQKDFKAVSLAPKSTIPLEFPVGKEMGYIGQYSVKAIIHGSNGYEDYDFYTVSVIQPFSPERFQATRHRRLFGFTNLPWGDLVANARLCRELGFGDLVGFEPTSAEKYNIVTKEGILFTTGMYAGDSNAAELYKAKSLSDPVIQTAFKEAASYFSKYRHHMFWKYFNEPTAGHKKESMVSEPKKQVEFMSHLYPVIKKEIPGVTVISSDPPNNFDAGRKWLGAVMAAGGAQYFDVLAIHPYREKPERPSLDKDSEAFIALADKYHFKGELWYTEGGYFPMLNLPGVGVGPTKMLSTDGMRVFGFTEDVMSHRVGLAFHLRTVLSILKYADRIKLFSNHNIGLPLDAAKQRPTELGVAYNALENILGNSQFKKEFKYSDTVKALLFDDGSGRGVAAIWDYDDKLENRERQAYQFALQGHGLTVTDSFGRPLQAGGVNESSRFAIDFMPVFIFGESVAQVQAALSKSHIDYALKDSLAISAKPITSQTIELTINNRGSDEFKGRIQYQINGQAMESNISVPPLDDTKLEVKLPEDAQAHSLRHEVQLSGKIVDSNNSMICEFNNQFQYFVCPRKNGEIQVDGDLSDWKSDSADLGLTRSDIIEYEKSGWKGPDDASAKIQCAWDDDNLYLALKVKDNFFVGANNIQGASESDSVQVFIDSFKDATSASINQDDDYVYTLAKTPQGDEAFRSITPNQQIAWLDNNLIEKGVSVKIKRDEASKTTNYEIKFPKKYIMPVSLKGNQVIGLGVMVNDRDDANGNRKSAVTMTKGKEAWQKPYNLPYFILEGDGSSNNN